MTQICFSSIFQWTFHTQYDILTFILIQHSWYVVFIHSRHWFFPVHIIFLYFFSHGSKFNSICMTAFLIRFCISSIHFEEIHLQYLESLFLYLYGCLCFTPVSTTRTAKVLYKWTCAGNITLFKHVANT